MAGEAPYSAELDGSNLVKLAPGVWDGAPAWLPDSSVLLDHGGSLVRVKPGGAPVLFLPALPNGVPAIGGPIVSPNGQTVYFSALSSAFDPSFLGLYRANADGSGVAKIPTPAGMAGIISLSGDGRRASSPGTGPSSSILYDLLTGSSTTLPFFNPDPYWSPSGDVVAVAVGYDGGILVYSPSGVLLSKILPNAVYDPCCLAWSQNGRYLLAMKPGIGFDLIDIQTETAIALPFTFGGHSQAIRIP
jgi:WD40 repeat protein